MRINVRGAASSLFVSPTLEHMCPCARTKKMSAGGRGHAEGRVIASSRGELPEGEQNGRNKRRIRKVVGH